MAPLGALGIRVGRDRVAAKDAEGRCVFHVHDGTDGGRLCAIQRVGGPSLLPSACRHFPRVVVRDPRGASVTLSHFCPTAAALLFDGQPLAIVDAPPSIALEGIDPADGTDRLVGLDATGVLPPLLAPSLLTDWDGYTAWEEEAVALFAIGDAAPERAVDSLSQATALVAQWRPGDESLASAVRRAFETTRRAANLSGATWNGFEHAVKGFLAAHAFASWAAYEPHGLRSVVDAVRLALATLARHAGDARAVSRERLVAAVRSADLDLRHRASRPEPTHAGA